MSNPALNDCWILSSFPAYDFLQYELAKCHKISQMTVKIIVVNIEYMEATEMQPRTDYL